MLQTTFLSLPIITTSFDTPVRPFHLPIYTDASNLGISVVAGPFAAGFEFTPTWRNNFEAHIGPAKSWALESGLNAAIRLGAHDCTLVIFCDNLSVIFSWRKGWSRSKLQNESISRINETTLNHNNFLSLIYINSAYNPSDEPSRGIHPSYLSPFPFALDHPFGTCFGPSPLPNHSAPSESGSDFEEEPHIRGIQGRRFCSDSVF